MKIKTKYIKFFLFSLMVASCVFIIVIFIKYRNIIDEPEKIMEKLTSGVNISVNNLHQVVTRDGEKEWVLEADSADFSAKKKELTLKNLFVTFHLENQKEMYLTANHGIMDTETNNIEVFGDVVIRNESFTLLTTKMYYDHQKQFMFTKKPVSISDGESDLKADTMRFDLNTDKIFFEGKVTGAFIGDITL